MLSLETLAAPPLNYNPQDYRDAMELPKEELLASLHAVVDFERGEKTLLRRMNKPSVAELVARSLAYIRQAQKRGPRPRKPVETRAERKTRGSRKFRRDCMSARKHRAMAGNKHHKLAGR